MTRRTRHILVQILIAAALVALAVMLIVGCDRHRSVPLPQAHGRGAGAIGAATAYNEATTATVESAKPVANEPARMAMDHILSLMGLQRVSLEAAGAAQDDMAEEYRLMVGDRDRIERNYTRLSQRWYVTWGRRAEWLVWIVGLTWLVSGIAGVGLTAFGGGKAFTAGRWLLAALPLANPFSWATRKLEKKA